ncbi:unnamed protein product [Amoebophrya sp. A120]|nr:unnamed protein product [Amoebophrya sp. A120]|eukprot:GSA120T00024353001.1
MGVRADSRSCRTRAIVGPGPGADSSRLPPCRQPCTVWAERRDTYRVDEVARGPAGQWRNAERTTPLPRKREPLTFGEQGSPGAPPADCGRLRPHPRGWKPARAAYARRGHCSRAPAAPWCFRPGLPLSRCRPGLLINGGPARRSSQMNSVGSLCYDFAVLRWCPSPAACRARARGWLYSVCRVSARSALCGAGSTHIAEDVGVAHAATSLELSTE